MKNPTLQYLTSSEPLTLEEEFKMQKRWLEDEDSNYLNQQSLFKLAFRRECFISF